jgi:hypothetical protein
MIWQSYRNIYPGRNAMSHNRNVAFLDFPDPARSLTFDSFWHDGAQFMERQTVALGMCICAELDEACTLSITWNGVLRNKVNLSAGSHKLLLGSIITAGEGVLILAVSAGQEARDKRVYRLVSDYGARYTAHMFNVFGELRRMQRLNRLKAQCPPPREGETLSSLSEGKYRAAALEVEQVHRDLGNLRAIDVSHLFFISLSMGDNEDLRKQIDSSLSSLADQLRKALQSLDSATLNVEQARYYTDQRLDGRRRQSA